MNLKVSFLFTLLVVIPFLLKLKKIKKSQKTKDSIILTEEIENTILDFLKNKNLNNIQLVSVDINDTNSITIYGETGIGQNSNFFKIPLPPNLEKQIRSSIR